VHSHLPLERQVRGVGATWLDRPVLQPIDLADTGFGATVRQARADRVEFLSSSAWRSAADSGSC